MNSKILLSCLLFFGCMDAFANKHKDYKWDKAPARVEIPEEFLDEDAVVVESELRYAVTRFGSYEFGFYYTKHFRVRILSKDGIASATRIMVPKYPGSKITVLDARTLKANGDVVDMKSDDIKEMDINFNEKDVKRNEKFYLFSVPGVEVGDEIEVIYVIEDAPLPYNIFLHEEFPVLKTSYTLKIPTITIQEVYNMNEMPAPEIKRMESSVSCTWRMTELKGIGDQVNCIESLELPHVVQIIRGVRFINYLGMSDDVSWIDYFDEVEKYVKKEDMYASTKYGRSVNELLDELWKGMENEGVVQKMKVVQDYLNENLEVVNMSKKEAMKPLGYFIETGKIENLRLLTLYAQIFRRADIPYYMAFGRNKYNGIINPKLVTMNQVDYLFFAFIDEKGKRHFMFPQTPMKTYALDELPPVIQGTLAIIVSAEKKVGASMILPSVPVEDITRSRKVQSKVSLAGRSIDHEFQESLTGTYSSDTRYHYLNAEKDNKLSEYYERVMKQRNEKMLLRSIAIDTFSSTYPHEFRINYGLASEGSVSQLDDGLYAISLDKWFWHAHDKIDKDKRWLKYFPPYPLHDIFQYYLVFDEEIELVNAQNLNNKLVHQQIGGYIISAKQVNSNVILLESKYLLSGGEIKKDDISLLADIHEAMEKGDNEPLVIKVK